MRARPDIYDALVVGVNITWWATSDGCTYGELTDLGAAKSL